MLGVYYNKKNRNWDARISYKGVDYFLISSTSKSLAAQIRKAAERAVMNNTFDSFMILLNKKKEFARM